jgi:hypothetical protein
MDLSTGSGYYISSTGSFRIGNPATNYLKWDNTDLTIKTSGAVTIGDATNYFNWTGSALSIKTAGAVTIGNPTGSRLVWDGSALSIYNSSNTAILTAGKLNWNAVNNVPYNVVGNLLDTSTWVTGADYSTTGPAGFNLNQNASGENSIIVTQGPDGTPKQVWQAVSANGNNDGGWDTTSFTVDHLKPYRFSCWIRRVGTKDTGTAYLGLGGNTVNSLGNVLDSNPYFIYISRNNLLEDRWYLFIGYVWPSTYTGTTTLGLNIGGVYDGTTGELIATANNTWKWVSGITSSNHRCYQFYSQDGNIQQFYGPRVDVADGSEPSIDALLAMAKATVAANSAAISAASAVNALQLVGSVTWLGDSTISVITGTELRKTGGTDGWNASRYSAESFVGGAYLSFQPYNSVYETMVGLNSDPDTNSSYTTLDYAWYFTGNAAYIWESNNQVAGGWGISNNSVLSIVYDNQYIRYYIDGDLKYTNPTNTSYGSAYKLYLDTSFKYVGFSGAKNIRFGPNASRGANGSNGNPGAPGAPGATGARGSATVYYGGMSGWNSTTATTYFNNTYGSVVLNDTMTQYGTNFSETRFYDTTTQTWIKVDVAIDGNLLVSGTISAAKLTANSIIANNIEFTGKLNTKSDTTGARMEMTNSTIKVYDANGVVRVKIGNLA